MMKPRSQLVLANLLMTVGVMPWVLTLAWVGAFFAVTRPGGPPGMPILDPLSMVGFMGMTFLFGLGVAGLGATWSWLLTRSDEELGSRKAPGFRSLVPLALLVPPLLIWLEGALKIGS
jgi:hypothetical protein